MVASKIRKENWTQIKEADIPHDPKVITVKMPRLHGIFVVLKNNLNEIMERSWHYGGGYGCRSTFRRKGLDWVNTVDSRNVEVISKLERCIRVNIRNLVDSITKFSINQRCWIGQHNCLCRSYFSIMVWPLWIRPSSICCQIPSA